ncbi:hypothetical protein ACIB24_05885 [Spongisporangium articulatum]|uniref:Thymidine phosphorylase n=1 Tax=Spongisporangium articulatum TaxID=3362603 RepID=A0ABW8AJQ0_9ACTN
MSSDHARNPGRAPGARPRRPALFGPVVMDAFVGADDPARRIEAAHLTAAALVRQGRSGLDPDLTKRMLKLADEGLDEIAELWSARPAGSLPGALWRLYALRAGIRRDPVGVAHSFERGRDQAPLHDAMAAVAEPPGPDEVQELADGVLAGAVTADLADALERAAAFCHVVAAGLITRSDDDPLRSVELAKQASALARTGTELEEAANLWRRGELE